MLRKFTAATKEHNLIVQCTNASEDLVGSEIMKQVQETIITKNECLQVAIYKNVFVNWLMPYRDSVLCGLPWASKGSSVISVLLCPNSL